MAELINPAKAIIEGFRRATPYIKAHRGRLAVLYLPDALFAEHALPMLVNDIALLSHLEVRLVLCFGLRAQIDARLGDDSAPTFVDGRRVTDDAALEAIMGAAGRARIQLESRLSTGLPNTPMAGAHLSGCSGNLVTAQPFGVHQGVDFQHTGSVRQVESAAIHSLLDAGHIVVLPPLGHSLTGEIFNLAAEDVALATAIALQADKLIYFLDKLPADQHNQPLRQANADYLEQLAPQQQHAALTRTMNRAVSACRQGVDRVHLLDQHNEEALLAELFTRDGSGTLVTADHWESIRAASIDDVAGIIELISPLQHNGTLATRSREQLELDIDRYVVIERDSMIIACAALFLPDPKQTLDAIPEIASVATHPEYRGAGRAGRLLDYLERAVVDAGFDQVMLLTTRTGHWFVEHGYVEKSLDALPTARRRS